MKNPKLLARKTTQARRIASRCAEVEARPPRWVAHLLGRQAPAGKGAA